MGGLVLNPRFSPLMQATAEFLNDLPQVVGILFDDPAGLL